MTKNIDCVIDRVEGSIAVLIPDDGSPVFEADVSEYGWVRENMFCTAVFRDGALSGILPRKAESDNKSRLERLFEKGKNK